MTVVKHEGPYCCVRCQACGEDLGDFDLEPTSSIRAGHGLNTMATVTCPQCGATWRIFQYFILAEDYEIEEVRQ